MSKTRLNHWWRIGIGAAVVLASAAAIAGITAQGITAQGITAQGITAQGITAQGITAQGITAQGITAQGITAQGITAQGITAQGITAQGITAQGITAQGITAQGMSLMGTDLLAPDAKGVAISYVEMRGLTATSDIESHTLTNIPTMSSGPGNYIAVSGGTALHHYAVAHTLDVEGHPAEDLDLYIAGADKDPVPNLFHNHAEQDNEDELYVVYYFHKWSGEWMSLCPYNPLTKSASAMAIPDDASHPNRFIFACTATGVASKCARNWGYRPWAETEAYVFDKDADGGLGAWKLQTFPLRPYYESCKVAAMAGYCQNSQSFTKTGTQVDLFDTQQVIWPNTIENPWNAAVSPDSLWMNAQEYFIAQDHMDAPFADLNKSGLQRSRYRELSPVSECEDFAAIDRLEHDHIEDGRWASLFKEVGTLNVFSPTYCNHDEYTPGDALPWDCSPCTTQVCKTMPECCGAGVSPEWTLACVGQAGTVCKDGATQWPTGKVWPKDLPSDDRSIYPTYLLGPGGAVLRADGVSGSGTSATISGWACDPEWAGATVAVKIYGGGTIDGGGTLLGTVRADQALADPLAREVSAACDGPGRTFARHGFSFTLPLDQAGNVYVYAVDESTDNGPPAPDTLLRNGVVQIPRCGHSEHVAGDALSETCSACTASVCGDGTHAACCTTSWTDECAAAADECASTDSAAIVNDRSYAAVATGWIEAPTTGTYTFEASQQPSRLFVNGSTVLDWFETSPGTTSGSIELRAGHRYNLRWDRMQTTAPSGSPPPGLTWQPPGTIGQVPIPSANLYAIAPGGTTGLSATYYLSPGYIGGTVARTDANIDINKDVAPPGPRPLDLPLGYGPSYSAIWEGEIIPAFTESYNFFVVGSGISHLYLNGVEVMSTPPPGSSAPGGCAHDLCLPGAKLDASCNSCVHDICEKDPYCCDGGYLSYYSFLPEWDARCIAEVATYCPGSHCNPLPAPAPVSPLRKLDAVPLKAGVHYAIRLEYDNATSDKTIRLLWASPRQGKQAVPGYALQPPGPPDNAGSGLNVTYFGTKLENSTVKADKAVASGMVADLSLTPPLGPLGLPQVNVLAAPVDIFSGKPSPPSVVRPRWGEEVFIGSDGLVHLSGIGGLTGGAVHIVVGGGGADLTVPVEANGTFQADVPVVTGIQVLILEQQTFTATPCVAPALCAASKKVLWPLIVSNATNPGKAPEILSPTDPTHSAAAVPLALNVVGKGSTGPVHIADQGFVPDSFLDLTPDQKGDFSGPITLSPAAPGDPKKGWHKLVFDQGGPAAPPVFASVGIDPPTVTFPRPGAEIDCNLEDSSEIRVEGTLPYTETQFGRLHVLEETGRLALGNVGNDRTIITPPNNPGDPIRFETTIFGAGPGRHIIYFFQAPDLMPNGQAPTQEELRGFSRIANTPTSRLVIEQKPPRFPLPQGLAGVVGGGRGTNFTLAAPPPGQGPVVVGASNCGPQAQPPASPFCALPHADVNVRINGRLTTKRADEDGKWVIPLDLSVGWNRVTLAQVSDSRVGGAWSESCLSNEVDLGVQQPGHPIITVPADFDVPATGPRTPVIYPDVTAVRASDGASVPVDCTPASGAFFRPGRNSVLCKATDPETGAVGLGEFAITVVDGPPTIQVFDLVLEADQPAGRELATYPVLVSDDIDRNLLLECIPPPPNFFLIDEVTPVVCSVTDSARHTVSDQFTVKVVDTTAPEMCPLSDIMVGTNAGAGAIVTYATCADDIVDGPVSVDCDHASGSFFPFGTTVVKCSAKDQRGNRTEDTFTVSVGDTTPPVLKMPNVVTAFATSRSGARVNYTVTATDNIDPNPKVKCTPPSGSQFPLGESTVTCKATDASGNSSQGTFKVRVIVKWSGLLPPIPADGTGVFKQGSTIPTKFDLVAPSDGICDLTARLYVAPVDAAGRVGPEKPAKSKGVGSGNTFAPTGNHYQLNLDTGPMAVGKWQLRVDLGDGEPHPTMITLR